MNGILFKNASALEDATKLNVVIFDKTGTLTLPEPRVVNAAAIDPELLQKASCLALSSRHPLAVALARETATRTPFDGATEEPGQGVRAMIGGAEARLGSAEFCGMTDTPLIPAQASGESTICFSHAGRCASIAISQKLRLDAV